MSEREAGKILGCEAKLLNIKGEKVAKTREF